MFIYSANQDMVLKIVHLKLSHANILLNLSMIGSIRTVAMVGGVRR